MDWLIFAKAFLILESVNTCQPEAALIWNKDDFFSRIIQAHLIFESPIGAFWGSIQF